MIFQKIKKIKLLLHSIRYKKQQLAFYKKIIPINALCFDCGANEGNKTLTFLKAGAAKVIAIEPQPACVEKIKVKIANNNRVVILQKAISNEIGMAQISICEERNTITTMSDRWKHSERFKDTNVWQKTLEVPTTTLDELIKEYGVPSFCKIDVEGFEHTVLSGLNQKIPLLSFEFTIEFFEETQKCIEHLGKLGYTSFNYTLEDGADFVLTNYCDRNTVVNHIKENTKFLSCGDIYAKSEIQ